MVQLRKVTKSFGIDTKTPATTESKSKLKGHDVLTNEVLAIIIPQLNTLPVSWLTYAKDRLNPFIKTRFTQIKIAKIDLHLGEKEPITMEKSS